MAKDLDEATAQYNVAAHELEQAKERVIDAAMAELRAGVPPTRVARRTPFSDVFIRKLARVHGIEPAKRGPKPEE